MVSTTQPCGLYLIADLDQPAITPQSIGKTLEANGASCLLISSRSGASPDAVSASAIIESAHSRDVAVFVENDAELALALGADGLHIAADLDTYQAARRVVGDNMQIGVACGLSRHQAMILAEDGADYVAFDAGSPSPASRENDILSLIEWWSQLFEVPCIAWRPPSFESARLLTSKGADYIALDRELWQRDNFRFADLIETGVAELRSEQRS